MKTKETIDTIILEYFLAVLGVWVVCILSIALVPFIPKTINKRIFE